MGEWTLQTGEEAETRFGGGAGEGGFYVQQPTSRVFTICQVLCKGFAWIHLQSPPELCEIGTVTIPILTMQILRHKNVSYLPIQGYPASSKLTLGSRVAAYNGLDGRTNLEFLHPSSNPTFYFPALWLWAKLYNQSKLVCPLVSGYNNAYSLELLRILNKTMHVSGSACRSSWVNIAFSPFGFLSWGSGGGSWQSWLTLNVLEVWGTSYILGALHRFCKYMPCTAGDFLRFPPALRCGDSKGFHCCILLCVALTLEWSILGEWGHFP